MSDIPFAQRVEAAGLKLPAEDLPKLDALVRDLDQAAALVRGPRPYAEEPASAFRLKPA